MEDALRVFRACRHPDEVFLTVILVGFSQNGLEEKAFELFAEMACEGVCIDTNMVSAVLGAFGASAFRTICSWEANPCAGHQEVLRQEHLCLQWSDQYVLKVRPAARVCPSV